MPNMAAIDELVQVVVELRETKIDKLGKLADRMETAISELGLARPATTRQIRDHLMHESTLLDRKHKALGLFHKWNDVTGFVSKGISYEGELESIIEDAVEIGYYGIPVTNAQDWEHEDTQPEGPSGICKDHHRDGDRGADDQEDVLDRPSDLQLEPDPSVLARIRRGREED